MNQLPLYQCHKTVRAAKIAAFLIAKDGSAEVRLDLPDGSTTTVDVSGEWLARNGLSVKGYLVQYEDGYTSYSPAEAFEGGYTLAPRHLPGSGADGKG